MRECIAKEEGYVQKASSKTRKNKYSTVDSQNLGTVQVKVDHVHKVFYITGALFIVAS